MVLVIFCALCDMNQKLHVSPLALLVFPLGSVSHPSVYCGGNLAGGTVLGLLGFLLLCLFLILQLLKE